MSNVPNILTNRAEDGKQDICVIFVPNNFYPGPKVLKAPT